MGIINEHHTPDFSDNDPLDIANRRIRATGDTAAQRANSAIVDANAKAAKFFEDAKRPEIQRLYTPEGIADLAKKYEAQVGAEMDRYVAEHDKQVAQLEKAVEAERASYTAPKDEAAERRIDRHIAAHRDSFAQLDGAGLVAKVQQALTNAADPEERSALLQMAPSYLESRGLPSEFINRTVAQVAPELAEKEAALREARREAQIVRANRGAVGRAVAERKAAPKGVLVSIDAPYADRRRTSG
ncbi:MAG TPA: hypothetical protein VME67_03720 [Mycobacterium sp.]|nr:hypothetical protein [Mycobacterium sp.]HTX94011.1 hypothetical protein [Mycobacterium sp.]